MVGLIPLKVIGPPAVMVIMPMAKRVGSPTEVATIVTFVGVALAFAGTLAVGTAEGAE